MPGVLNLGLECLKSEAAPASENVLSYEYLDAVFEYNAACEEVTVVFDQFESLLRAADNLQAVADVIAEQGVTPALEALVGENFIGGVSAASVEAASDSVWGKIGDFFVKIWQAIKQFFLRYFSTTKGMRERLQKFHEAARETGATVDSRDFTGLKLEVITTMTSKVSIIKEFGRNAKGQFETTKKLDRTQEQKAAKAADVEKKLSEVGLKKYGEPTKEMHFSSLDEAVTYADALYKLLTEYDKHKDDMIKDCDEAIKRAKDNGGDNKDAVADAQAYRDLVIKCFKSVYSSAAAFLAHTSVKSAESKKED